MKKIRSFWENISSVLTFIYKAPVSSPDLLNAKVMRGLLLSFNLVLTSVFAMMTLFTGHVASASLKLKTPQAGPVLIVSDIDDTLKISHILSGTKYLRTFDHRTPFKGMPQLLELIMAQNPGAILTYVSNAPESIAGVEVIKNSHMKFLAENHFPQGEIYFRSSLFEDDFKIKTIRALVAKHNPSLVIMIGDNGEQDATIYDGATSEFSAIDLKALSYIHALYSSKNKKEKGQTILASEVAFATPVDIVLDLQQKGVIDQGGVNWFFKYITPQILSEKDLFVDMGEPMSFPSFKNCSDYKWLWPVNQQNQPYKDFVEQKCR